MDLFKDWECDKHNIKEKNKKRLPKKQFKKHKEPQNYNGRTYTDYLEYKI